ncbi:DUF7344 domain-containing protein [Haladaptatus sp. DFWS20]|uniref:DUF7344 domain-containing protein n=1 Tax=Haladaptatus sp. DFWS20 TaxID=3403467 RepID=UPI003EB70EAE
MSQCELHSESARLDAVFDMLSNDYRREILFGLMEGDLHVSDISRQLQTTTESERERIELALYGIHLPKLDRFDFIEWSENSDNVRRGERFEEIRPVLERVY